MAGRSVSQEMPFRHLLSASLRPALSARWHTPSHSRIGWRSHGSSHQPGNQSRAGYAVGEARGAGRRSRRRAGSGAVPHLPALLLRDGGAGYADPAHPRGVAAHRPAALELRPRAQAAHGAAAGAAAGRCITRWPGGGRDLRRGSAVPGRFHRHGGARRRRLGGLDRAPGAELEARRCRQDHRRGGGRWRRRQGRQRVADPPGVRAARQCRGLHRAGAAHPHRARRPALRGRRLPQDAGAGARAGGRAEDRAAEWRRRGFRRGARVPRLPRPASLHFPRHGRDAGAAGRGRPHRFPHRRRLRPGPAAPGQPLGRGGSDRAAGGAGQVRRLAAPGGGDQGQPAFHHPPRRADGRGLGEALCRRRHPGRHGALRRPVLLRGVHRPAAPHSADPPQGRVRGAALAPAGGQPLRQEPARHPARPAARRAVPGRRGRAVRAVHGHPRVARPPRPAPVHAPRPLRPLLFLPGLPAARALLARAARQGRRRAAGNLQRHRAGPQRRVPARRLDARALRGAHQGRHHHPLQRRGGGSARRRRHPQLARPAARAAGQGQAEPGEIRRRLPAVVHRERHAAGSGGGRGLPGTPVAGRAGAWPRPRAPCRTPPV